MDRGSVFDAFASLVGDVYRSDTLYAELYKPDLLTHPIPFFGNIERATILTVGVNPSATEFEGRNWPPTLTLERLWDRLNHYFVLTDPPPHTWFQPWSRALTQLGYSYEHDAAHLDLSPRATKSMGSLPRAQVPLFLAMMERDAPLALALALQKSNLKGIFLAGAVTNKYYMGEFIKKRIAPVLGLTLDAVRDPSGSDRKATRVFRLRGPSLDIPVFFCSNSPSSQRDREAVSRETFAHRALLRQLGLSRI